MHSIVTVHPDRVIKKITGYERNASSLEDAVAQEIKYTQIYYELSNVFNHLYPGVPVRTPRLISHNISEYSLTLERIPETAVGAETGRVPKHLFERLDSFIKFSEERGVYHNDIYFYFPMGK